MCDPFAFSLTNRPCDSTEKYIPEGEVFQAAFFTAKWNKERVLLISDSWLYNVAVTYFPTVLGPTKVCLLMGFFFPFHLLCS